jgi:ubiquinone biosynthesis protein
MVPESRFPAPDEASAQPEREGFTFEILEEKPVLGLLRRFLQIHGQLWALILGWLQTWVQKDPIEVKRGLAWRWLARLVLFFSRPFLNREWISQPFPVQFRLRLEKLGPTFIKLGQILSLRKDILPSAVTEELLNLLDHLPVVRYERYLELLEEDLKRPVAEMFAWVDEKPLGSASLAQIHRARLHSGEEVVLKLLKPGIRKTVQRDLILLRFLGRVLENFLSRFQPKRLIEEFCKYTGREVDMRLEADNAEQFAANFQDQPDVVFPKIYRQYSGYNVLCMTFIQGLKPNGQAAAQLTDQEKEKVVNLGAMAIIRMIYQDGFFHADLHPGNLFILPGPKIGFIDLGMVGRYDTETRKNLLYYFYALVSGDPSSAAYHLAALVQGDDRSDLKGFRQAIEDLSRRWFLNPQFDQFSLGQLILESLMYCGRFRVYYPGEMVLMVKALITFEGVGYVMDPDIDIAKVSAKYVRQVFLRQFNLLGLVKEGFRYGPEMIDALVKSPMLISEGVRMLEKRMHRSPRSRNTGLNQVLLAGFSLISGVVLLALEGPWPIWGALMLLAFFLGWKGWRQNR